MEKKSIILIIGVIGIFSLIAYGIYYLNTIPNEHNDFARCLAESDAKMYGTDWCKYCKKQKSLFEGSFEEINYINCDYDQEECALEGITGYPTWKINKEAYPGVQSLERLSSITECEL